MLDCSSVDCFVICLASRVQDRCDPNMQSLQQVFPRIQRAVAVDAAQLDIATDPRVSSFARTHIMQDVDTDDMHLSTPGAVGCALSHIGLWKHCLARQRPCIIIEDDVRLDARKQARVRHACSVIPADADFASIMYNPIFTVLGNDNAGAGDSIWGTITPRRFAGLQMYYVTPSGCSRLLREALPVVTHVDVFIGYVAADPDFHAYFYRPRIYGTMDFLRDHITSSIGHTPSVKNVLPASNVFYGTVLAIFVGLVVTVVVLARRVRH